MPETAARLTHFLLLAVGMPKFLQRGLKTGDWVGGGAGVGVGGT